MPNPRVWTTKEVDYLRENFGKLPRREMAKNLGRTPKQVGRKTESLGLVAERSKSYYSFPTQKRISGGKIWTEPEIKDVLWRNHKYWERRKFIEIFNISSEKLDELYDEVLLEHNNQID